MAKRKPGRKPKNTRSPGNARTARRHAGPRPGGSTGLSERLRSLQDALRDSEERYQQLFNNANDIVYALDLEGRFTSVNQTAARLTGYSIEEFRGQHYSFVIAPEYLTLVREMVARKIAGRGPTIYEIELVAKDGHRFPIELASQIVLIRGRPAGIQGIARDITERKRAEAQLRQQLEETKSERAGRREAELAVDRATRLQRVTAGLARALTAEDVAEVIIDEGVPAVGASAALMAVVTEDGTGVETVRSLGYADETVAYFRRVPLSAQLPITEAVRNGVPIFIESQTALMEKYEALREAPVPLAGSARACLPLIARTRILGALVLVFGRPMRFEQDDREFMLTLAQMGALALERSRLYEREHHVAETLQRALLPGSLPVLPGVEFHAAYRPGSRESEVGGDWFDVFDLPGGEIGLSVGDVMGRGLQSAIVMGEIRQSIRVIALTSADPATVLQRVNSLLRLRGDAQVMATAVFGVFDPLQNMFRYATAGHPAPVLATRDGKVRLLPSGGLPLGFQRDTQETSVVPLPPGALLVLYTDGLVEATRDFAEGEAALASAVRAESTSPSPDPAEALLDRMLAGRRPMDDAAVVTLRLSLRPLDHLDLTLPAVPSAVPRVRQAFRRMAAAVGLEEASLLPLAIALGEAVTNVVQHAYGAGEGTVRVAARVDGPQLVIEVQDSGQWCKKPEYEQGHGLHLMREFADVVEIDQRPGGTGTVVRLRANLTRA